MLDATSFVIGILLGLSVALWLFLRSRSQIKGLTEKLQDANQKVEQLEQERTQLQRRNEDLQREIGRLEEQARWLNDAESKLREAFEALAGKVLQGTLQTTAKEFVERARDQVREILAEIRGNLDTHREELRGLIQPLENALEDLEKQVMDLENKRAEAYGNLERYLSELSQNSKELQRATTALAEAFRKSPTVRGDWGEIQLYRIVELAGMEEHVDFNKQQGSDEGRPDLIIRLPNNGVIPLDAKVNLKHFLEAFETPDDNIREQKLEEHARAIRQSIQRLSRKAYWDGIKRTGVRSPEFVIMFVPNEVALTVAFQKDPNLLEEALKNGVILTTPVTLFALLKAVAYGWMQHKAVENAEKIANKAKELYERLCTCLSHISTLGQRLKNAVESYNELVGSLESRVLPSARSLKDLQLSAREMPQLSVIDEQPRKPALPEAETLTEQEVENGDAKATY